jgi:small-conductance mechanosensitive channel
MVFVALGLAMAGAQQLQLVGERRRLERGTRRAQEEPPPVPAASRHEVDVLCDQLRADLAQSPEAVRGFLQEPEKTVESLRQTCRALDERRRQLFAEAPPERLAALEAQRAELLRKHAEATDAQARRRLDDAAHSLRGQVEALQRLRQNAERVDGEYTSLLVLLQELRTRVSLARSAGSTTQLEGLHKSVQRLNVELDAITEALEAAQHEGMPAISDVSGEDVRRGPGRDRERS